MITSKELDEADAFYCESIEKSTPIRYAAVNIV